MANTTRARQSAEAHREEKMMYGHGATTEQELDERYPNRPHNHSGTLPFHELFLTLFNPLNDNKKKPTGPAIARKKQGPHGGPSQAPNDVRKNIIERFISRWRKEVGNDIYPAFRLIVPEKDRDRGMYGLKEMALGKLLIRILKIDKNSDDGYNLTHWKLPGVKSASANTGDFAGRCFDAISKRPMRSTPGDMTIAEVNEALDRLSVAQKEENQRPILEEFYGRMNAEEMMWLIRIILRQMKVGATEKTFFDVWHPDAENLFNISSNLRRVCWELYDRDVRLEGDDRGIALMQCFQPQLAAFQMRTMEQMVARMNPTEEDPVFWIEEKLDGERMQMHMMEDDQHPGAVKFCFWSRKAKDYTYLYGNGFNDDNAALTRHIKEAFHSGVRNIILDGEMITWNIQENAMVPFGTLKTAALEQQKNPFADGNRPLYRVFDCLYLNDKDLTQYALRERRKALKASVTDVPGRIEVHTYREARNASEIDPELRRVVAESSEGLVLKNPRSVYRLNERNADWIKVKPEYMTEFGESLDCIVIGGYYGSGKRGGGLSSFLCGLYLPSAQRMIEPDAHPQKCLSFFKVGGGFSATDYAQIRHQTEGKWKDWDRRKPPNHLIVLGGGEQRQFEKPDVWIHPEDSVVVSVKAASAGSTDQFAAKVTLRFPRFKRLRTDKSWNQALSFDEFSDLKAKVEHEQEDKKLKVDESRKKRTVKRQKRELVIQGEGGEVKTPYSGPATKVFEGLTFFIMTEAGKPIKMSKAELEQLVKANGGNVVASHKDPQTIVVADRNVVKVASIKKSDARNIIKPSWLLDCVKQSEIDLGRPTLLLPLEPHHIEYTVTADEGKFDGNVDEFGDSYTRDIGPDDLRALFMKMPAMTGHGYQPDQILAQLAESGHELDALPGLMFHGTVAVFKDVAAEHVRLFEFAGGMVGQGLEDDCVTHVVVSRGHKSLGEVRRAISSRHQLPRIVTDEWVGESWAAETRLDEEREWCYPAWVAQSSLTVT
jgi:DNA ligase-4